METVQLTVSRPAGESAAWREERERGAWRKPASPPTDWRTSAGQEPETWRSPGTGSSGGAWAPPTPPTSRKKSLSQVIRDNVRSEVRRSSWKKKELFFELSKVVDL